MIKLDTQSHRTILVLLIIISPGPPPEAPLLPIAPPDAFAGLFMHIFLRCFGLIIPESVMAMAYRSHKGR